MKNRTFQCTVATGGPDSKRDENSAVLISNFIDRLQAGDKPDPHPPIEQYESPKSVKKVKGERK